MLKYAYRWHQTIGAWVSIGIILWGISGLAHPILSAINPKPKNHNVPQERLNLTAIQQENVVKCVAQYPGKPYRLLSYQKTPTMQFFVDSRTIYCDLRSGLMDPLGETRYAKFLAYHYYQLPTINTKPVRTVTEFDDDYLSINRFLPVVAVDFNDSSNTTVYVDTRSGRLGTIVNDTKRWTAWFFRYAHNWLFIGNETVRHLAMTVFLALAWVVSLLGLYVYIKKKPNKQRKLVRYHRFLSVLILASVIGFTATGTFHLWNKQFKSKWQTQQTTSIVHDELSVRQLMTAINWQDDTIMEVYSTNLIGKNQFAVRFQERKKESHQATTPELESNFKRPINTNYWSSESRRWLDPNADQNYARQLAAQTFSVKPDIFTNPERITRFGGEYGFIQKRLPVWKFTDTETGDSIYVDTISGVLSTRITAADRLEGWWFAYLHKWRFLDFMGKTWRDVVLSSIALIMVIFTLMGLILYQRRFSSRPYRRSAEVVANNGLNDQPESI